MTFLLPRRKKVAMNVRDSDIIRSPQHMRHVRGFVCAIFDKPGHECSGRMHAHHCREGADGGTGLKPGDNTVVPLCDLAHAEIHNTGWRTFETKYGVDLSALAERLWRASAHRLAFEKKRA
jgi:hypothetical protein